MYVCTPEELILVNVVALLYKEEVNYIGKYTGIYTHATIPWAKWELLLDDNWQGSIDRITMTWETVTWVN